MSRQLIIRVLLELHVDVTGLVDAIVPILRLVTLQNEGTDCHVELVQVHALQCVLLLP